MMLRVILGWCRARGGDMASFQGSEKVANVSTVHEGVREPFNKVFLMFCWY